MTHIIRRATQEDKEAWVHLRHRLWPDAPLEYLGLDLDRILADPRQVVFVACGEEERLIAFIEVRLREYAEGSTTTPVGYIEAWFVEESARGQKLGRELMITAEHWAREQGCTEMGSDTWLDNETGISAHWKMGFFEVERLVHFLEKL